MIRQAKVVAVHPPSTVDVLFLDDHTRMARVPVSTGAMSSDTGSWSLPDVPRPSSEATAGDTTGSGRQVIALVAFTTTGPVVIGFTRPPRAAVAPTEQNREVHRHASGTTWTIAPDGTIEWFHPSGAYIRLGDGDHSAIPGVPDAGGGAAATLTFVNGAGKLTLASNGDFHAIYPKGTYEGPSKFIGDMEVEGQITASTDVIGAGKSLKSHTHTNVRAGTDTSGPPQ